MKTELSTENKDIKIYIGVESKTDTGYKMMNKIANRLISLATEICRMDMEENEVILD